MSPVDPTGPIPYFDLRAVHGDLRADLAESFIRVVDSGWFLLGPDLEAFERAFAAYRGTRHCLGVAIGVSALERRA